MKRKVKLAYLLGGTVMFSTLMACSSQPEIDEAIEEIIAQDDYRGYPDFGFMVSPTDFANDYPEESIFRLSQDYPKETTEELPDFYKYKFDDKDQWMDWINGARDYCFEGMIENGFVAQQNELRNWYHMPYLHYDTLGTEGFHGLAKEASEGPYQLRPNQTEEGQTYALGFYNDFSGPVLEKMWGNPEGSPNAYATQAPDGGFPHGTVIFKLLFSTLDEQQVDYLVNPFTWTAYITEEWTSSNRIVSEVNLIQMDLMVRDTAADKYGTGWIFGTFCYNGALNDNKPMAERVKNLVPVGIQFGNDPEYTTNWINPYPFTETIINDTLQQTYINPSSDLPPQHLGWGGRLDGPVDLNTASCMSCHSTGEFPQVAPLVPSQAFIGDTNEFGQITHLTETDAPEFKKYFSNIKCGTAYDPELATSTDFSLQVSLALQYYWNWKNQDSGGYYASEYERVIQPVRRNPETN